MSKPRLSTRPGRRIRVVDPSPPPGTLRRGFSRFAATRPSLFLSRHISWHLDPLLLRLTRGRLSTALAAPVQVLQTRGARTGSVRRNAVIYFHDLERPARPVIIAASNAGAAHNPAWYHNLVAHPEVSFGGAAMRAQVVEGPERERLWRLADRVFPADARYRQWAAAAGREIPLIQLTPQADAEAAAS